MPGKRIVICCDGTWNTPDKADDGVPLQTNVVKIAAAVKPRDSLGVPQVTYYDAGVGTRGSWLKRVYDGATGSGLSRNILEAYDYLVRNYVDGDELFLLGFSRGAFTVRSLAGLIRNSGILKPNAAGMIGQAMALYKSRSRSTHPREREAMLFRKTYSVSEVIPIAFIGVWDTVGSLGNPLLLNGLLARRYRFHDTDLSSTVANAFHAVAVDEKRRHFAPTLWHQQPHAKDQRLEQVWFVGAHSNVGGGVPSASLSDVALDWMVEKARECGLALEPIESRPDVTAQPDESRTGPYRLIPRLHRPIDVQDPKKGPTRESLHPTVMAKFDSGRTYRPVNLVDYRKRFPWKPSEPRAER